MKIDLHQTPPAPFVHRWHVFAAGFRPFFLLAAAWAAMAVPVWLAAYAHGYLHYGPLLIAEPNHEKTA